MGELSKALARQQAKLVEAEREKRVARTGDAPPRRVFAPAVCAKTGKALVMVCEIQEGDCVCVKLELSASIESGATAGAKSYKEASKRIYVPLGIPCPACGILIRKTSLGGAMFICADCSQWNCMGGFQMVDGGCRVTCGQCGSQGMLSNERDTSEREVVEEAGKREGSTAQRPGSLGGGISRQLK